ncbi:hypothetical protein Daus18300_010019 [Diaporthe australafricana]|uniref:Uncharacterized protein n=1 Tax=Diaporthe australafricana TaxID=127596 RepID=A0ABR3WC17_9PEZI
MLRMPTEEIDLVEGNETRSRSVSAALEQPEFPDSSGPAATEDDLAMFLTYNSDKVKALIANIDAQKAQKKAPSVSPGEDSSKTIARPSPEINQQAIEGGEPAFAFPLLRDPAFDLSNCVHTSDIRT